MKYAVIVVDMLNDFVAGKMTCERALSVIAPIQKILKKARQKHIPIVYTNDEHHKNVDHELKLWGDHAIKGTKGANVISQLKPQKNDYIIPKRHYSGFFETNLHSLLRKLKVDSIIVTGIYADVCVAHTIADAYQWGYQVIVPKDTINSFTKKDYEAALIYFKKNYNVKITTANEIIKRI